MADLHRSRVARSSDMVYDPQLWVQRRRRDFYFHLRLYCGVRLRPRDAQVWLCGCVGAHSEAGLADLYGTCAAVRDPCRGSVLRHDQPRETVLCERNGDSGFPQAARRKPDTGAAAEIPSIEYGRLATLYRADVFSSLDPADDKVARQPHPGDFGRALHVVLEVRSAPGGLSEWFLVVQSLCLAIAVRVRRLVRAGRRQADVAVFFRRQSRSGSLLPIWPRRSA